MLRNDAYWFLRLGMAIERADNTARLLDVKFHARDNEFHVSDLVDQEELDFYHWSAILRSVSAF